MDIEYIFKNIDQIELEKLKEIVLDIEKKFSVVFKKDFIELMEIFLYVSLDRIRKGHIIDRKINYKFLVDTPHYEIVKDSLNNYIKKDFSYELVHITEYFISGGVTENIGELKDSIEKYLNGLIVILKEELNSSLDYMELSSKLMGYLIPAIYRLKNNFSIKESGERDEIFHLVEEYSKNEKFLFEKLTENEIFHIAKEIKQYVEREKNKVLSLKVILDIVEKNCRKIDREKLIEDLIKEYGTVIKIDI